MIVLNWNGKDDTLECLASLSKVDYPRCRIIVVDNASSDDSVPAIKSAFPDVKVLRNRRNLGYAGGNNVGIRYALSQGYDYITLLNNDTIVSQDLFSALLRASVNIGVPAILSPLIYYHAQPRKIWYAGGQWTGYGFRHARFNEYDCEGSHDYVKSIDYACGCCLFTSKSTLLRVGLFDEKFFLMCEETDWCFRARRKGIKSYIVSNAKIWHKVSVSFGGNMSPLMRYFLSRNILLWGRNHLSRKGYVRLLIYRLKLLDKMMVPHFYLAENNEVFLKRLFWAGLSFSKTVKKRLADPAVQAELAGMVHHFLGRYGDCPPGLRARLMNGRKRASTL